MDDKKGMSAIFFGVLPISLQLAALRNKSNLNFF
jgi:hypothetical protein